MRARSGTTVLIVVSIGGGASCALVMDTDFDRYQPVEVGTSKDGAPDVSAEGSDGAGGGQAGTDAGLDVSSGPDADAELDVKPDTSDGPVLPPGCTLPDKGSASVRLGNLVPSLKRVDFCLKPSAKAWAEVHPLIQYSGADCPKGLGYKDVTAAFSATGGAYDVKVVAAGDSCEATGLTSLAQAVVEDNKTTSLYLFGDGATAPTLKPFYFYTSRPSRRDAATPIQQQGRHGHEPRRAAWGTPPIPHFPDHLTPRPPRPRGRGGAAVHAVRAGRPA